MCFIPNLTLVNSSHSIDAFVDGSESQIADWSDAVTDKEQVVDLLAFSVFDHVVKSVVESPLDDARTRLTLLYRAPFVRFAVSRGGGENQS